MTSNQSILKDKSAYLRLMLDSFGKIRAYTAGMSYANFIDDGKTQSAVIMQLQVVGELAKSVPDDVKTSIDVPWKNIAGLRDLIAHQYFNLDLAMVWHTTQESILDVEKKIQEYLNV